MIFKNEKVNIDKLANKVYEEFLIKNEVLRRIITDNNLFELDNIMIFTLTSFTFHMYFFRILLLSKYSDQDIQKVFAICLNTITKPISNDINDKNKIVDSINEIFNILDILIFEVKNAQDKEQSALTMQEVAKFFIESVKDDKVKDTFDSIVILKITTYFTYLLTDKETLLKIEGK